jgi:hypothetical protein
LDEPGLVGVPNVRFADLFLKFGDELIVAEATSSEPFYVERACR